ncbi:sigma-70 family RNA polymerase sigma factor [Ferrimonas senticii]|uniref:sigma-70 family RNA polymerase sigma factor n=1 Tax=Ferrimonas senticii TaxID=394566 RepID=UPI001969C0F3|nr:sigma-70 family RNA polymerase sigma factor [Ferrimonas senticii]
MIEATQSIVAMGQDAVADADQQRLWIQRIADLQDKAAFARLFRYYAPRLLNHARKHFTSDAQAEEMVQETMTKVWLKAHLYHRDKGQVSTWLFTIARNVRFDMLRRQQARPEQLCAEEIYLDLEADFDHEEPRLDGGILRQQLKSYCNRLPDPQRLVVEMIYFEDRSQQEVADALDIPLGTVKSRLRLALAKIRELIDD